MSGRVRSYVVMCVRGYRCGVCGPFKWYTSLVEHNAKPRLTAVLADGGLGAVSARPAVNVLLVADGELLVRHHWESIHGKRSRLGIEPYEEVGWELSDAGGGTGG